MEHESFVSKFSEWVGLTESPEIYFKYAALSLVAACLANRVYVTKQMGAQMLPVRPNLYTLLLGPSGNGKSLAASRATSLLHRVSYEGIINLYEGKMTAPAMYETMHATSRHPARPFIYVVNDELANDIGMGEYADQFVKSLTRMYLGAAFDDSTVSRGLVRVPEPYCVNWLACTTREWLARCMRRDVILGGFFARVVVVEAGYTGRRIPPGTPVPPEWAKLDQHIVQETTRMLHMAGEFQRTPEAVQAELDWYMKQPVLSEGDPMAPTERRGYDMLLKYEQVLSAAEGSSYLIEARHVFEAAALVEEASKSIPNIANFVSLTDRSHLYKELLAVLERRGTMGREELCRVAYDRGVHSDEISKLVTTWTEAGLVEVESLPPESGGVRYKWRTGK